MEGIICPLVEIGLTELPNTASDITINYSNVSSIKKNTFTTALGIFFYGTDV